MEHTTKHEQILERDRLHSTPNGRDYIQTPEGEIYSINGLYCTRDGQPDRWGSHVRIIDIRWTVVIRKQCYVGLNEDGTYKTEPRLIFNGDQKDAQILAHYGYRYERDADGYNNVYSLETK